MNMTKHLFLTSIAVATILAGWQTMVGPASAHMAPMNENSSDGDYRHHKRWRDDWNRRWDNNWGNSWSSYDNDVVDRRRYTQRDVDRYQNNVSDNSQIQETWSSIAKPSMDIPNFHEVHPWVFRGGQPNPEGMHQLYDMGVRTVIDLRSDPNQIASEQQMCQSHGMNFISIPMGTSSAPSQQSINKFLSVIDNAHKNGGGGAVYVHCHHGSDRTGAMMALYRMKRDSFTYTQAYNEMMRYGFNPSYTRLAAAVKSDGAARVSASHKS